MAGREWTVVDEEADSVVVTELQFEKTFLGFDFIEIKSIRGEVGTEGGNLLWLPAEGSSVLV